MLKKKKDRKKAGSSVCENYKIYITPQAQILLQHNLIQSIQTKIK